MAEIVTQGQQLTVMLVIGPHKLKIRVKKDILIQNSLVLAQRLSVQNEELGQYTQLHSKKKMQIFNFEDMDPTIFLLLLNCIHSGFEASVFTPLNWPSNLDWTDGLKRLYQLAKDLEIKSLMRSIEEAFRHVNESTACQVFQKARDSNFPALANKALDIILRYSSCITFTRVKLWVVIRHPGLAFEKESNYQMLTTESFNEIFTHNNLQLGTNEAYALVTKWEMLERRKMIEQETDSNKQKKLEMDLFWYDLGQMKFILDLMSIERKEELLQSMHEIRSKSTSRRGGVRRKYYQPLEKLPPEIITEIFSHLSREDVVNYYLASPHSQNH